MVELCVHKLHDMAFWKELKGRVADPDPSARMPITGEAQTSDDRTVEYRSRPLPDGATLIAFTDVTDARRLESALADREQALYRLGVSEETATLIATLSPGASPSPSPSAPPSPPPTPTATPSAPGPS